MIVYNHMSQSIHLSKKIGGKIEVCSKNILNEKTLPLLYTPGVADISRSIAQSKKKVFEHTLKKDTIAVISDGSAVLGLGNIGPEAALPVMEGKALLLKEFAGVNAFPLVLGTQDTEEIIQTIKNIAPGLGGINLEDISAPRCFEIEKRLIEELDIPVFHDDQHGTAIVVLAGLYNALKIVGKNIKNIKIVISGSGAAGVAIAKLLKKAGARNIIMLDRFGALYEGRAEGMNHIKKELATFTNKDKQQGKLADIIKGSDVFVGVSAPNILKEKDVLAMAEDSIVFALSNPVPEIDPTLAKKAGVAVLATGRSDFPNQINNVLVFPGLFRGALENRVRKISDQHKVKIAQSLAALIKKPNAQNIIPSVFDKKVHRVVAKVFEKKRKR